MAIAFPTAEGYGAGTQGAREPGTSITVYRVTNLNDSGSGSLRAACEASGPRIIVFTIGGTITCNTPIEIENPYCTILGQTAPGGGITLTRPSNKDHGPLKIAASEVILRHIRIRAGEHKSAPSTGGDAMRIGTKDRDVENVIVDHVTCSWATDETLDVYQPCENVTVQWVMIDKAIMHGSHTEYKESGHGMGIIFGPGCKTYSFHHSIVAHCMSRAPRTKTEFTDVNEQVGNVIYNTNWEDGQWGPVYTRTENGVSTQKVNVINNTIKVGQNAATTKGYMMDMAVKSGGKPEVYHDGCRVLDINGNDVTDSGGRDLVRPGKEEYVVGTKHTVGHSYPVSVGADAEADYDLVLESAGCTIPARDSLDRATITEIKTGTGWHIEEDEDEVGGLPSYAAGTPYPDTDGDGLPDEYCIEVFGSVSAGNGKANQIDATSGYTYVELWSFGLAGDDDEFPPPTGDISLQVGGSADDAYVVTGGTPTHSYTSTRLFAGHSSAADYNYRALMRFNVLPIMNLSAIETAYFKPYVSSVNGTAPTLRIYAMDEDDAGDLDNETDVTTRLSSLTTAYVEWTPAATLDNQWTSSPDISAVLEEVIARAGWVSNSSIVLVVQDESATYTVEERIKIVSYDSDPNLAAKLEINGVVAPSGEETDPGTPADSGTVDQQVSVGVNDGWFRDDGSGFDDVGTRAYAGDRIGTYGYVSYALFTSLGIPQGATIDTAYMTVEPGSIQTGPFDLLIYAADEDDAATVTSYANGSGRTQTTAQVSYQPSGMVTGTKYDTVSIVTILQELVDRAGWTDTSNALLMMKDGTAEVTEVDRRIGWKTYEQGTTDGQELYIEWSVAAIPPTVTPVDEAVHRVLELGAQIGVEIAL